MVVPDFARTLDGLDLAPLTRGRVTTLQVNVGKRCNQACHHCHVGAGPRRTEMMGRPVAERIIALLEQNPEVEVLDVTGGAPELNENFRYLVMAARRLGRRVIDRCNLTVLLEPEMDDLAAFLAQHGVEIVASLPCYREGNVDEQRGGGVFTKSIAALQRLNALGYGRADTGLALDLVYNPVGAFLPPSQAELEGQYRDALRARFGIEFRGLLTITNMPIKRFAAWLARAGQLDAYLSLLVNHFNAATVSGLMCRSLLSVGWDGHLYDCDFNQMLDLPLPAGAGHHARTIWELAALGDCHGQQIATGSHCFGCTAGCCLPPRRHQVQFPQRPWPNTGRSTRRWPRGRRFAVGRRCCRLIPRSRPTPSWRRSSAGYRRSMSRCSAIAQALDAWLPGVTGRPTTESAGGRTS